MLQVGADFLRSLVAPACDARRARQDEIIVGMARGFASTLAEFEIATPLRIAHFAAQVATESDGFCTTEEYASGIAYEFRADLGNVEPGDGERYKGRGLIQLTGRANYARVGTALGLDLVDAPTRVNEPLVYLRVACMFWREKRINEAADANDLLTVTSLVNGGEAGLATRKAYLARAKALVASLGATRVVPPGSGHPILHRGSEGDAVADLQARLRGLGYPVGLDGDFGPATELAVARFQMSRTLDADGIVGAVTWGALASPA